MASKPLEKTSPTFDHDADIEANTTNSSSPQPRKLSWFCEPWLVLTLVMAVYTWVHGGHSIGRTIAAWATFDIENGRGSCGFLYRALETSSAYVSVVCTASALTQILWIMLESHGLVTKEDLESDETTSSRRSKVRTAKLDFVLQSISISVYNSTLGTQDYRALDCAWKSLVFNDPRSVGYFVGSFLVYISGNSLSIVFSWALWPLYMAVSQFVASTRGRPWARNRLGIAEPASTDQPPQSHPRQERAVKSFRWGTLQSWTATIG